MGWKHLKYKVWKMEFVNSIFQNCKLYGKYKTLKFYTLFGTDIWMAESTLHPWLILKYGIPFFNFTSWVLSTNNVLVVTWLLWPTGANWSHCNWLYCDNFLSPVGFQCCQSYFCCCYFYFLSIYSTQVLKVCLTPCCKDYSGALSHCF